MPRYLLTAALLVAAICLALLSRAAIATELEDNLLASSLVRMDIKGVELGLTQKKLYVQQQNVVSHYNWHPLPHEYT